MSGDSAIYRSMGTQACAEHPSTQDVEVGASGVQGLPRYEEIFEASPGYMRLLLKNKTKHNKNLIDPNQSIHRAMLLIEDSGDSFSLTLPSSGVCHLSPCKVSLSLFRTSNGAR